MATYKPIAGEFARLPNDLQRAIYKMATHNPFKPIKSVEREYTDTTMFEFRQTPTYENNIFYTIQATWDMRKPQPTIRDMYVHRYTPCTIECIMSLGEHKTDIRVWQLEPYLLDLIAAYRARKIKAHT